MSTSPIYCEPGQDADRDRQQRQAEYRERLEYAISYLVSGFVFASDSGSDKDSRMAAAAAAAAEVLVTLLADLHLSPLERQFKASQIVQLARNVARGGEE